jgi:hypothetical protein
LGLFKHGTHIFDAVSHVVDEIEQIQNGCKIFHAGIGDYVAVKIFIVQFIADMPQRNVTCGCKKPTADRPCCHCLQEKSRLKTGEIAELRNVEQTRSFFEQCLKKGSKNMVEEYTKSKGIAPLLEYKSLPHKKVPVAYKPNPFWRLFKLYGFDIHVDSVIDLFHIEFLGLLVDHTEFLFKYVFDEKEKKKIFAEARKINISGNTLPPMEHYKYWNGDNWITWMMVSPYVLFPFMNTSSKLKHYKCWICHLDYLVMLLKPSLSLVEIKIAKEKCLEWRRMMIDLYPQEDFNFPNFHCILHLFPQMERLGVPILYWTRPFEHKHKTFRGINATGNFKNVEVWSSNKGFL